MKYVDCVVQVAVGRDRQLPLASFRETTRPVLLAGSRTWLKKALAAAEPYRCPPARYCMGLRVAIFSAQMVMFTPVRLG